MRVYVDGEYRNATAEEIIQIQSSEFEPKSSELSDADKLRLMLDAIPVEKPTSGTDLPFKLGQKWVPVYDGNKFAWQLVDDPDAIGTADNPIYYVDDGSVPKIENAYYIIDGTRYVYMSGQFIEF